jgi:hypothetical protein
MFIRELQREIAIVAIAACAPMVFGCATTTRFVVDPDLTSTVVIEAVKFSGQTTACFDAAGGFIDPAAMTITGKTRDGELVMEPLAAVKHVYVRYGENTGEPIATDPAALVDGAGWQPDGEVQYVALRSGEVVDLRKTPTTVDAEKRVLNCASAGGAASTIPFDKIVYLQIKDDHPGRTGLLLVVSGILLAVAVVGLTYDPM